jgi:hypothetical protein
MVGGNVGGVEVSVAVGITDGVNVAVLVAVGSSVLAAIATAGDELEPEPAPGVTGIVGGGLTD